MSYFKLSIPRSSRSSENVKRVPTKLDYSAMTPEDYRKHRNLLAEQVRTDHKKQIRRSSMYSIFAAAYGATNQLGNIQPTGSDVVGLSAKLFPLIEQALIAGSLALNKTDNTNANLGKRPSLVLAEQLVKQLYPELCVSGVGFPDVGDFHKRVVAPKKIQPCGVAAAPKPEPTKFERLMEFEGMANFVRGNE